MNWYFSRIGYLVFFFVSIQATSVAAEVRMPGNPSLSPDGTRIAFEWKGDIWTVPAAGGKATRLSLHAGKDREPKFSPDGRTIAFTSDREGTGYQIFLMDANGGPVRQITQHTAGYSLQGWSPDGKNLLALCQRDHGWRHADRFYLVNAEGGGREEMLFDDYGQQGSLNTAGDLLYAREGTQWWRKSYYGSQASQVWLRTAQGNQKRLLDPAPLLPGTNVPHANERGALWPTWLDGGKSFFYVGAQDGSFNLWEQGLDNNSAFKITSFKDDLVINPSVSADSSTILFRRLFDLYLIKREGPGKYSQPVPVKIEVSEDMEPAKYEKRSLTSATAVDFASDGLEIVFVAGGDLWIMDSELKEPLSIIQTPSEEREPVFSPDGESILFVGDKNGQTEIYQVRKGDPKEFWWRQKSFDIRPLTKDGQVKSGLRFHAETGQIAFNRGRGELVIAKFDPKTGISDEKPVVSSFSKVEFDWSPDGKWMVYSKEDQTFNRDVFIKPLDGSREPFNLSRHPRNDSNPVWSPDGKIIAFLGQREKEEVDIKYAFLTTEESDRSSRDRLVEKALEKMKSRSGTGAAKGLPKASNPLEKGATERPSTEGARPAGQPFPDGRPRPGAPVARPKAEVNIDFDRLEQRVKAIPNNDIRESQLFWSPDSKKLAFLAGGETGRGVYTVEFPEDLRPKQVFTGTGSNPKWLKSGQVAWLSGGLPATFSPGSGGAAPAVTPTAIGGTGFRGPRGIPPAPTPAPAAGAAAGGESTGGTPYRFTALQIVNVPARQAEVFDQCWRTMRDNWYDERLNNRDWNAVRAKYLPLAMAAPGMDSVAPVVQMMLGELNGSHLNFTVSPGGAAPVRGAPATEEPGTGAWRAQTPHFGLRFDTTYKGPGFRVKDVIPGSPANKAKVKILPGEIVLSIDGFALNPAMDYPAILNGPPGKDYTLVVKGADAKERTLIIRPLSFPAARALLYDKWLLDNEALVHKLSNGKLGYLHISAMDMPSFYRFEEKLAAAGLGRDGLIIDVRENGGGSTADLLLTALTQPGHSITVPRNGQPGYPHDRLVYPSWDKPITVLCNQNSFSNAEIFSHAIKHIKRGKLVGVPTAGGVISTGGTSIMDVGFLRLPFRGWYLPEDGQDLELNGAVPDFIVWPQPGELPAGKDTQIEKAVEVLSKDVETWKARPKPKLIKASERPQP